ncbi:serine hydrolase domain-containing protein [Paraburkholderia haematera]|uniref:D-alanyl-D-alanine carboxypeptidase n=1 Tax=Paraburkholderia haematera TaxID=2793077 RepID=A0ABM8R325_9BURK|nr:serine hydrolase domain-containing protein [Paraburkholderia haematera]CAE6729891.1 D-alanyl-D-alanine carboxypeptidase [Paraburkholderia haematera]
MSHAMLNAELERFIDIGIPGISAAIANRTGVIWSHTAGFADITARVPMTRDYVFGVGSITKTFISVLAFQLAQEGLLSLDATPLSILGPGIVRGIANADTATIAQLMNHTAGIPSWEDDPAWIRDGRGETIEPSRRWGKGDTLDYIRGDSHPALFPAAQQFSYSNTNFTLLGLVIEHVACSSLQAELHRRIIDPLELTQTYLEGFEERNGVSQPRRYHYATETFRQTAGIAQSFPELPRGLIDVSGSNLSVEWAAGGMVSSPRDLVRFGSALRDGELLRPDTFDLMRRWVSARLKADAGHGLFRFETKSGFLNGHTGGVLGSTGCFWWAEKGDCVVAVLANVGSMHAGVVPASAADVALHGDFTALAMAYAAELA